MLCLYIISCFNRCLGIFTESFGECKSIEMRVVIGKMETRIACILVLTVDRDWRRREVGIHRIKHHSTNPINAYRWRTPRLVIGSKGVCCTRNGYPIRCASCVCWTYRAIWASYAKWHGIWHIYCNDFKV